MKEWIIGTIGVLAILAAAIFLPLLILGPSTLPASSDTPTDTRVRPETPTHTDVPCGTPTVVTVPQGNERVTYRGFTTSYGTYRVVATLTDTGETFNLEGTGYTADPVAPYIASHHTPVIEPCRDADPVVPIIPSEDQTQPPTPAAPEPTEGIKPCESN